MSLVSVLIIAHNQRKYISEAVNSVLSQQGDVDYEILIGDDCSTDGTTDILEEFRSRFPDKIKLFVREKNIGASKNLYLLLAAASGKYVATLEGDDYWCDKYKLISQVEFMETHPQFIGCCGDCTLIGEDGRLSGDGFLPWISYNRKFTFKSFKGIFLPGQTSTMMYRNIFSEYPELRNMYEVHPQISDRTIVMLYSMKGNFYRLSRILGCYRKFSDGSVTDKIYKNENSVVDYDINEKLSQLASDIENKKICFRTRKLKICGSALIKSLIRKSPANSECLKQVISRTGRIKFIAISPIAVFVAIMTKLSEKIRKIKFEIRSKNR